MEKIKQNIPIDKILSLLEQHLGATTEVVYHDLTKPYDQTIVDIRHGEITGRKVGGCGSNLGLEVMRGVVENGDRFNYITHTRNGKILRSSSVYLYDADKLVGALCVNTDISESVRFENYLKEYNAYNLAENDVQSEEHFVSNVTELLDLFIIEAQQQVGKAAPLMNKKEKMQFLEYLDKKGAFLISKSSETICNYLGISKVTLYSYLEAARNAGAAEPLGDLL